MAPQRLALTQSYAIYAIMEEDRVSHLSQKRMKLASLREQHRDLDASIEALEEMPLPDQLRLTRLKRQKLKLKDQIRILAAQITPDIIA